MNRALAQWDLTAAQAHIMCYLVHQQEPPCARDLEGFFRLTHPTISGLLRRMEAKGFLEQRSDLQDRRIKRIYPLEKSLACQQSIDACIQETEEQLLRGFSPEEQKMLLNLLKRAAQNIREESTIW